MFFTNYFSALKTDIDNYFNNINAKHDHKRFQSFFILSQFLGIRFVPKHEYLVSFIVSSMFDLKLNK